jgi:hypothetical protein
MESVSKKCYFLLGPSIILSTQFWNTTSTLLSSVNVRDRAVLTQGRRRVSLVLPTLQGARLAIRDYGTLQCIRSDCAPVCKTRGFTITMPTSPSPVDDDEETVSSYNGVSDV